MNEKSVVRKVMVIFGLILVLGIIVSLVVYFDQNTEIKCLNQIKPKIGSWVFNNQSKVEHYVTKAYDKAKKIIYSKFSSDLYLHA